MPSRGGGGGDRPSSALLPKLCGDLLLALLCVHPRELREKIQPEILELIKQQRLNRLCEGSSFRKIGNRRRQGEGGAWGPSGPLLSRATAQGRSLQGAGGDKSSFALCVPGPFSHLFLLSCLAPPCVPERFWYCRLALNHKVLHYGDLDDNPQGEVTFESLQEKSRFLSLVLCPGSWTPCQESSSPGCFELSIWSWASSLSTRFLSRQRPSLPGIPHGAAWRIQ